MTDKEKIAQISKQCRADWRRSPANTDIDTMLADRLIEAGFVSQVNIESEPNYPSAASLGDFEKMNILRCVIDPVEEP